MEEGGIAAYSTAKPYHYKLSLRYGTGGTVGIMFRSEEHV